MKKLLLSFITILLVIFTVLIPETFADDEEVSVEFNFTSSTTVNVENETVTLIISLGELSGIDDGSIMGFEAVLSYDDSIFDSVSVSGLNNWTVTYSSTTGKIVADTTSVSGNTDIAELVFTLNEEAVAGETTVTLSDVLLTDGTNDFEFTETCTITITSGSDSDGESSDDDSTSASEEDDLTVDSDESNITTEDEESTSENNTSAENTTVANTTSNEDNTTSSDTLPYTGTMTVLLSVFVIALICIFFGIKWNKYVKDTKNQL